MALANAKAHVNLNGKDYILIEESYEKRAQQPFTARFATGDPTEGDNSFWQFLSQRGWVSEGQEIFSVVNNFRQSSGWDIRGNQAGSLGHPRIGFGIENLSLLSTPPVPYSVVGALLIDDFASGTIDWTKWNDGGPGGDAACDLESTGGYGSRTGYDGVIVDGPVGFQPTYHAVGIPDDGFGNPFSTDGAGQTWYKEMSITPGSDPGDSNVPARGMTINLGGTSWFTSLGAKTYQYSGGSHTAYSKSTRSLRIYQIGKTGLSMGNTGDYSFDLQVNHTVSQIHAAFAFLMDGSGGGGYVLEISGAQAVTAKLIKTTKANAWDNTADTVLKTWTLTAHDGIVTNLKLSLAAGVFTLKQDGSTVSGGTVTDTTYSSGNTIRYVTAHCTAGTTTIGNINIPGTGGSAASVAGKFLHYNNKLMVAYKANTISAFIFTDLVAASIASNLPAITHLNANDICVWNRDGDPSGGSNSVTGQCAFLCAVAGQTLNIYRDTTIVYTVSITAFGGLIVPVDSNTLLVIGTAAANSGAIVIDRLSFTANTWTLARSLGTTIDTIHLDGGVSGQLVNSFAFDANGTLFFASNDLSGVAGMMPSRCFQITATDLLAVNLTVSSQTSVPDFVVRGIAGLYNSLNIYLPFAIYLLGASIEGNDAYPAIMRYPGELVYKSTKSHSLGGSTAELFNFGIGALWATSKCIRFLSANDDDSWDPIVDLDVDQFFREVASFNSGQFGYANPNTLAIAEWSGRHYLLNAQAGTLQRTANVRGGLGTDFDTAHPQGSCIVKLSDMGRNTSLINKSLFAVYLELSEALPASTTFRAYVDPSNSLGWSIGNNDIVITVNGIVVGIMTSADCVPNSGGLIRKEIILPFEMTCSIFTPRIHANAAGTWTGFLKYFMLKYVPSQFKKRAWGFGIRATKRLKMGDGSHEQRTPAAMFADIEAAWASNTPLVFIDVDGVSYSVIVTDFKQKRPLLPIDRLTESEAFYFVEVLEV